MFEKCILHIGSEKTGTTSIQSFLKINRDELKSSRVFVPATMGYSEHVEFANQFALDEKRFSFRKRLGLKTPKEVGQYKREIRQLMEEELHKASKKNDTLIISTERLFTLISSAEEIIEIREFLEKFCKKVVILCYLRPQHEFAVSIYSTSLKNGRHDIGILPDPKPEGGFERKYYYGEVLEFWRAYFPDAEFIVRRFGSKYLVNNDVTHDFIDVLGLSQEAENYTLPVRQNTSLSWQAQVFLNEINKYIPSIRRPAQKKNRGNINATLERFYAGEGKKPLRADAITFYNNFSDDNEKVRKMFFPDESELFAVNFDKYPDSDSDYELTMEEATRIFAKVYLKKLP